MEVDQALALRKALQRTQAAEKRLAEGDGRTPGGGFDSDELLIEAADDFVAAQEELGDLYDELPKPVKG